MRSRYVSCYSLTAAVLCLFGLATLSGLEAAAPAPILVAPPTTSPVVQLAEAFLATLSAEQRRQVVVEFNAVNAAKWSNFPCGLSCREGLLLSSLTPSQQAAALAVVQAATGTTPNEGYDEIQQLRAADDNLAAMPDQGRSGFPPGNPPAGSRPPDSGNLPGGKRGFPPGGGPFGKPGEGGYGSAIYSIAFLGQPTATGPWMLQFGGHHLATSITFNQGAVTGASPKFEGVEPLRFTTTDARVLPTGTACDPLVNEADGMLALLGSLTAAQQAQAKLQQSFRDVVAGPGQDGKFPARKVGLPGSALMPAQRLLLLAAMKPWVLDADDATAARLLADYAAHLPGTYLAYAGSGTLTQEGDYVRLDGPGVWIELVCQRGVVYHKQLHYHSIWRDHLRDYGGNFYSVH